MGIVENLQKFDEAIKNKKECYDCLVNIFDRYIDTPLQNREIVAVWTMAASIFETFETFPYLFFNAMKGSGKTRFMRICAFILEGDVVTNITESVLFRQKRPIFVDESENMDNEEKGNLIQLLNSGYKKGSLVKRSIRGEKDFEVKDFDPFRPIGIANIEGMNDVTEDRSIKIILEKSTDKDRTRRMEMFGRDPQIMKVKTFLSPIKEESSVVNVGSVVNTDSVGALQTYNYICDYLMTNYTTSTYTTTPNYTNYTPETVLVLERLQKSDIQGRDLELWMPLFVMAAHTSEDTLDKMMKYAQEASEIRMQNNMMENRDIVLIGFLHTFISGRKEGEYLGVTDIVNDFNNSNPGEDEWFNSRWVGRALIRNGLSRKRRRVGRGMEVMLDFDKITRKARQFGLIEGLETFTSNLKGECEVCHAGNRELLRLQHQYQEGKPLMKMCRECGIEYGGYVE